MWVIVALIIYNLQFFLVFDRRKQNKRMSRDQRIKQNYKELSHIDNSNHLTTKRLYVKLPENVNDDTIRRRSCISPIIARKSMEIERALEQRTQSVGNIGKTI